MSTTTPIDDGGSAFPQIKTTLTAFDDDGNVLGSGITGFQTGMTLRDWFAGQALAGGLRQDVYRDQTYGVDKGGWVEPARYISARAYAIADAMIAARKAQP